jgi:hypothetical protein
MTECIAPNEIHAGDLAALVDGAADERVWQHVRRCKFCAEEVGQRRSLNRDLTTLFYRFECPPAMQWVEYQHDLLSPDEKLVLAAHLRQCHACRQELAELEKPLLTLQERVTQLIQGAFQWVEALRVPDPVQTAPARGGQVNAQQIFQTEGLDIVLDIRPSNVPPNVLALLGEIVQVEQVTGSRVWLLHMDQGARLGEVDNRGTFEFGGITPGIYAVVIETVGKVVALPEVRIGPNG